MPHEDWPRFHRRRWWREPYPDDEASSDERTREEWQERMARFRPMWWPENEPWPPMRPRWPRSSRRPFMRRLGCLFLFLNLFVAAFFVAVIITVLNGLGITSIALHEAPWVLPIGGILLVALLSAVTIGGASLRRMSIPLDDLLTAANRVAEGDYSARVTARGPAEVRSLATAFNSMAAQLESHDRQRRAMLADVTHELRTPLTIIQGNLEGVLDGMYVADPARLRSILDETQILARLTDDLRTLSLAESGSLELRREPVDLVGLLRVTIAAFQSQADSGGVRIDLSAALKEKVLTVDAERIRQVLTNLIANAIRYSPRGSAVRADLSGDGAGARITVTDSGPGIAAADLPHVFDRYYKSADSRGMGLGLSIAKYIVEAHGGQIQAESQPGQGTTIWFTLPA